MNQHVWSLEQLLAWAREHGSDEDMRRLAYYHRLKADRRIWERAVATRLSQHPQARP